MPSTNFSGKANQSNVSGYPDLNQLYKDSSNSVAQAPPGIIQGNSFKHYPGYDFGSTPALQLQKPPQTKLPEYQEQFFGYEYAAYSSPVAGNTTYANKVQPSLNFSHHKTNQNLIGYQNLREGIFNNPQWHQIHQNPQNRKNFEGNVQNKLISQFSNLPNCGYVPEEVTTERISTKTSQRSYSNKSNIYGVNGTKSYQIEQNRHKINAKEVPHGSAISNSEGNYGNSKNSVQTTQIFSTQSPFNKSNAVFLEPNAHNPPPEVPKTNQNATPSIRNAGNPQFGKYQNLRNLPNPQNTQNPQNSKTFRENCNQILRNPKGTLDLDYDKYMARLEETQQRRTAAVKRIFGEGFNGSRGYATSRRPVADNSGRFNHRGKQAGGEERHNRSYNSGYGKDRGRGGY